MHFAPVLHSPFATLAECVFIMGNIYFSSYTIICFVDIC